jgi:hypothetical protein
MLLQEFDMLESVEFRQLDVSDQNMTELLIDHLNAGTSVRLFEIVKSSNRGPDFTLLGKITEQEGSGIIISGYCSKREGALVIIE